jgi:hypothetical protein
VIAEIIAGSSAAAAIAGWIFAYRARGESRDALQQANAEAARAQLAEAKTLTAIRAAEVAEAQAAAAVAELDNAKAKAAARLAELNLERAEKGRLLAKLAEHRIPVGAVLVDDTLDRLYPDADDYGGEAGQRSEGDHAARDLPGDAAKAATPTKPNQ